jgi:hypothetical protein
LDLDLGYPAGEVVGAMDDYLYDCGSVDLVFLKYVQKGFTFVIPIAAMF